MSTSIVAERVTCLHGGQSGGMYRGHPVLRENMTTMKRGKTTIHICSACKIRKQNEEAKKKARRSAQDVYARVELDHKETL